MFQNMRIRPIKFNPIQERENSMKTTENLNKCPNCGGIIELNDLSGSLYCRSCNSAYTYEQLAEKMSVQREDTGYDEYICNDCGAETVADENALTFCCAYCGNTSVMKNRISGNYHPDYIIPFGISPHEAERNFMGVLKYGNYIRRQFRKRFEIKSVTSLFVPFWLYDCDVSGSCAYKLADGRIRNVNFSESYEKIPVDASVRIDDNYMDVIEPFDYGELKPFDKVYLIGHTAERYDTEVKLMSKRAELKAKKAARTSVARRIAEDDTSLTNAMFSSAVRGIQNQTDLFVGNMKANIDRKTGGLTENNINFESDTEQMLDEVCVNNIKNMKTKIRMKRYRYALFPVYLLRGEYKGKTYLYAINGQNGRVSGKFPSGIASGFLAELFGAAFGALLISAIIFFALQAMIKESGISGAAAFGIIYALCFLMTGFLELKTNAKGNVSEKKRLLGIKPTVANAKRYRVSGSFRISVK